MRMNLISEIGWLLYSNVECGPFLSLYKGDTLKSVSLNSVKSEIHVESDNLTSCKQDEIPSSTCFGFT
jgi:hypothetical protein